MVRFVRISCVFLVALSPAMITPLLAFAQSATKPDTSVSGAVLGSEHQKLLEQEEALLRQLTGGSDTAPSDVAISTGTSNAAKIITALPADTQITSAALSTQSSGSRKDPLEDDIVAEGLARGQNGTSHAKVEQLIDEQARAALAAIADVKQRSALTATASDIKPRTNSNVKILTAPQDSFVESIPNNESAVLKVTNLSHELGAKDSEVSNLKLDVSQAERKTALAESRASSLAKQVEMLRGRLMVAETEVERLSRVIEARNKQGIMQAGTPNNFSARSNTNVMGTTNNGNGATSVLRERVIVKEGKAAEDLPVVLVTSDKANLRIGPGQDNSSLMSVSRGTRLVVETRQGEWFRVFTPNGVRAWISADTVQLQRGGGSL